MTALLTTPLRARQVTPAVRILIFAGLLLVATLAFLTLDVKSNLGFIMQLRLPKVLSMMMVGWATGVATVAFQTVTHNKLLTPSIMGLDSLYVFIQTLLIIILGTTFVTDVGAVPLFALNTGLIMAATLGLVALLFGKKGRSVHILVLAGLVLGTVLRSASSLMQRVMDPTAYLTLQGSLFASFTLVEAPLMWTCLALIVVVSAWLMKQASTLDVVMLGRDQAVSLGVDYRRFVRRIMLGSVALVAISTALVGPITFLGLIVAAIAYIITGTGKHRYVLPIAGLLGAFTLVGGQTILEHLLGMGTVLSVIIEFVGGIIFILLVVRSSK